MTKSSPLHNISQPFKLTEDIVPKVFNMLGTSSVGLQHLLYLTETTRDILRVDVNSQSRLSPECYRYYIVSNRSVVGSLLETRSSKTKAYPYKVLIGNSDNIQEPFTCITPLNDKGGIVVYKDLSSNLLLVTSDLSFSSFVVTDT